MAGMDRDELATRLAKEAGVSRAAAADRLDQVIHRILKKLRRGKPAALPGLGQFLPGQGFRFEPRGGDRKGKK
jgi:nucleoid DNA-binding protein